MTMNKRSYFLGAMVLVSACGNPPAAKTSADDPAVILGDSKPAPTGSGTASAASAGAQDVARGIKLFESGDLPGAKAAFEAAIAKNPKDPDAHHNLGLCHEKAGEGAAAERAYREAVKLRVDHDAATNLGALLLDAGKVDDAVAVLRPAADKRKDNPALRLNLALALAAKGDRDGASRAFDDAAKLSPRDPMVLLSHGQWLGRWKDAAGAVDKLKQAATLGDKDVGVLASAGFELKGVGAYAECIDVLGKAITLKDAAELRTYRALCRVGQKDHAGAIGDLKAALQKEPKYAPAHFYLAGRMAEDKKFSEAAVGYETYLKLEPEGPLAKAAQERAKLARSKLKK